MKSSLLARKSPGARKSAFAWIGQHTKVVSLKLSKSRIGSSSVRLFVMLTCLATSAWAQSAPYSYQIAAKTGDVISGHTLQSFGEPSLSNDGTILFWGTDQSGQEALYSILPGTNAEYVLAKQGDTIGGLTINSFGEYKRNNAGAVVFQATVNSTHQAIFELNSQAGFKKVVADGDTVGGVPIQSLSQFDLNDSGAIVFTASWNSDANSGVFTPHSVIAKTGDTIGGITLLGVDTLQPDQLYNSGMIDLSNDGIVAFRATYGNPNQPSYAIFTQNSVVDEGGETIDGLTLGGSRSYEFYGGGISKTGGLICFRDWDYAAVIVGKQVVAQQGDIVDGYTLDGPFDVAHQAETDGLAVNAQGEAVFYTRSSDANGADAFGVFTPTHAVFVGNNITIDGIAMTAASATFSKFSLNDAGQVALAVVSQPLAPAVLVVATPNPQLGGNPVTLIASYGGVNWDAGNYHWQGTTSLELYPQYVAYNPYQNFIWTPFGAGFTICSTPLLGVCLSDQNGVVTLGSRHDVWTISNGNGVIDLTTGNYMQAPASAQPGAVITTGPTATSWAFSF
jgi:hypothetical protein